jgi:hypothetical protein
MSLILDDLTEKYRAGLIEIEPFIYSAIFPVATFIVGANLPVQVPIQADADFLIRYGIISAFTGAGVLTPAPQYYCLLTDTSSGRAFMDNPVPVTSLFGSAQWPFCWPEPKLMFASSNIQVQLVNADISAADVWLSFVGFKIYNKGKYQRR